MPGSAMSAPTRPAPPPPSSASSQKLLFSLPKPAPRSSKTGGPNLRAVSLVSLGVTKAARDSAKKKPAPPRPPPPKVQTIAFGTQPQVLSKTTEGYQQSGDLLIDWSTPPGSPTTGRSSSDGLSLRSFGSDSSGGVSGSKPSRGTAAPSESGFESETEGSGENVPGTLTKPFSMPTIIRPSRSKASLGRPTSTTSFPEVPASASSFQDLINIDFTAPASVSRKQPLFELGSADDHDDLNASDYSPPEPNIPPPSLPSQFVEERAVDLEAKQLGKAVALYTYESTEPGDLNFKEGDEIEVFRQVNTEWLHGSSYGREGMFPANFVRLLTPLPPAVPYRAVAKFAFHAETHEDLELQEGDIVHVTSLCGNGWLFGCVGDRQGQFPESFVARLS